MGIAVVHHTAVFQSDDALGLHGNGVIVGDEHHGIALPVQLLQHFQYLTAGVAVQCAGGLVGQNDSRTACQCPRDGNTLLLTAGKLVGLVPELIAKAHLFQCSGGTAAALPARHPGIHQRNLHVFHQAELGQQVILLKDEAQQLVADLGQFIAAHSAHIPAIEFIGARRGHIQTADDVHAGGFAGARLAHDGHELALVDLHRNMICSLYKGIAHLVILAHMIKFNEGTHQKPPPGPLPPGPPFPPPCPPLPLAFCFSAASAS